MRRALKPDAANEIHTLVALAEERLGSGHRGDAADLLRAAEHLSFAALAHSSKLTKVSEDLHEVIVEELDHITERANEHWKENKAGVVAALFQSSLAGSAEALGKGAYQQALELARAAEALSHVKTRHGDKLEDGDSQYPKLRKP